jgi:hypothetical protein
VDRFHQENPKAIRAICLKEELDNLETMPNPNLNGPNARTSPMTCWTFPAWDDTPAPPTWGLLIPSPIAASWDVAPTFQYKTLFGNLVTTCDPTPKDFKWESEERRQAADDMFHFLKVIEQAQDFEEKVQHTFKSGRKALLYRCEENCKNCGEPATCQYWGS